MKTGPHSHGFSMTEILITCAIVAVMGYVAMNIYNGINNSAMAVAQQKDQAELNQVIGMLHMSGGNIAALLPDLINNNVTGAAELTYVLQNPVSSSSKTLKGTMGGSTLPSAEYIIPFPYTGVADNGRNRIVFNPTSGAPSIAQSGPGFIVVNINNSVDYNNFKTLIGGNSFNQYLYIIKYNKNSTTTSAAATSNPAGTKYASANNYVWDEDASISSAPVNTGQSFSPPTMTSPASILFAFAYNNVPNSYGNGSQGAYQYQDYVDPSKGLVYVFAYRSDMTDLAPSDLQSISAAAVNNPNSIATGTSLPSISSSQLMTAASAASLSSSLAEAPTPSGIPLGQLGTNGSLKGMLLQVPLNTVLPATAWTANSQQIQITATTGTTGTQLSAAPENIPVVASAQQLNPPQFSEQGPDGNTMNFLTSGDQLVLTLTGNAALYGQFDSSEDNYTGIGSGNEFDAGTTSGAVDTIDFSVPNS